MSRKREELRWPTLMQRHSEFAAALFITLRLIADSEPILQ